MRNFDACVKQERLSKQTLLALLDSNEDYSKGIVTQTGSLIDFTKILNPVLQAVVQQKVIAGDWAYADEGNSGMDAFARGLKIAAAIRADGVLEDFVRNRYSSYDAGIGKRIESGAASFTELETYMLEKGDAAPNSSGRQEMLENLINRYI